MKLSSSGYEEEYPLSPVFSQEFAPDTQSQSYVLLPMQNDAGSSETGKRVRVSFTALGLALSLGATGSLVSSAEAADSTQLAALPTVAGSADALPSFGSSRPEGMSASYHTVADGETIWDIAKQHGLTVEDIKLANGIVEGQTIQSGQVLKVPTVASSAAVLLSPVEVEVAKSAEPVPVPAEVEVAALPESGTATGLSKVTIAELQLNEPQAAPNEVSVAAATEPAARADETATNPTAPRVEVAAAPRSLPEAEATDTWTRSQSVARVDAPATETSAVRQLSEQLNATVESAATKRKAETDPQESLPVLSAEGTLTHRVGSGETIWSIARSYGLDPETLQRSNQIADPRFILPGDEIVIPANQPLAVSPSSATEHLSHRQLTAERQMAAIAPLVEIPSSSSSAESAQAAPADDRAATSVESAADMTDNAAREVAVADPFVEEMLSEVAAATESQVGNTASVAARQATEISTNFEESRVESAAVTSELEGFVPAEVAVNPQFAETEEAAELDGVDNRLDAEELLAAAPLGSEVYAPVIENPAGRVVTPEMPVLPGRDAYLPEAPNRFDGYMWPAQGVLTSGYGWRWGRMHRGVDIAGPVGTPIYAAGPGVVVASGWNSGGYGNLVDIRHPDGSMTRYAHNSRLLVSAGQQVRQGQQIAEMGSTGYSTGPHLHFEIHLPNQGTVNPIALLPGR